MRLISNEELMAVAGGEVGNPNPTVWDASATHTSGENSWGQSYKNDTAGTGSFSNVTTITIFGTELNFFGGAKEGLTTAATDCGSGATLSKLTHDIGTSAGFAAALTSAQTALVGCTLGVGAGIIRDLTKDD